jgi:outer membrane receptor protein involved in Fe transport
LFSKDVSANLTVKYIGEQHYNNAASTTVAAVPTAVDSATIFNLGARWENAFSPGLFMDGRVYNVMDTEYYQGGQSQIQDPFRQAGRWWLVSLGYEF